MGSREFGLLICDENQAPVVVGGGQGKDRPVCFRLGSDLKAQRKKAAERSASGRGFLYVPIRQLSQRLCYVIHSYQESKFKNIS